MWVCVKRVTIFADLYFFGKMLFDRLTVLFFCIGAVCSLDIKGSREKAEAMVKKMELPEKFSLMSGVLGRYTGNIPGVERLGIPAVSYQDGPQGFRTNAMETSPQGSSTAWPSTLSVAAAWDKDLALRWGAGMGEEFKALH